MSAVFRSPAGEGAAKEQSPAPAAAFFSEDGKKQSIDLPPEIFAAGIKTSVVHESVRSRLAAVRAGTHSTKTRGEVRGGGVKPWRQKGTGRARHGSIREPQWVGGGIAHGPKPRRYRLRVNKKARAAALKSALSDRASEGRVVVVEIPAFDEPKTKRAAELLNDWSANGKVLVVFSPEEQQAATNAWKSFRNLPLALPVTAPAPYTVLEAEWVVLTRRALESLIDQAAGEGSSAGETGDPAGSPAATKQTGAEPARDAIEGAGGPAAQGGGE